MWRRLGFLLLSIYPVVPPLAPRTRTAMAVAPLAIPYVSEIIVPVVLEYPQVK